METKKVRVRFAPSPTGGLHLGGVRTALYNYLFAHQNNGDFILRIEDTDQTRFVDGAESYIYKCLEWCGIMPNESPLNPGECSPYRQSERKPIYAQYAQQLISNGYAYIAFDTPEELEAMREKSKEGGYSAQYDNTTRLSMRNSLSLSNQEVDVLLSNHTPHVIRFKMPPSEKIVLQDIVRGEVAFDTELLDDKVLLKADGMPTYHLAVVVDDYLMKISHVFRGEEWLPSLPLHVLLWKYLGWEEYMPQYAHLPLILKPDGNGKLSKRDGDRLGFPVFAMDWIDPTSNEKTIGFKERGFLPEAFINMLALLGWSSGSEKEIFSKEELIKTFSIDRVHRGGAKFDYEKAKWFNYQYIQNCDDSRLASLVSSYLMTQNKETPLDKIQIVLPLVKERLHLLSDFEPQTIFFFKTPENIDLDSIKSKWSASKQQFFDALIDSLNSLENWSAQSVEAHVENAILSHALKKGDVMLPMRIMLVGAKFGPGIFDIAGFIGKQETIKRIKHVLTLLN